MSAPTVMRRGAAADHTTVLLAAMLMLFALSFPATKAATTGLGVGTATGLRFLLAAALLVPFAWRGMRGMGSVRRPLLLAGALGLGVQAVAMVAGIDAGSASLAALVLGLEPIGIAVCAALIGGESLDRRTVLALLVGFGGVAIVSGAVTQPLDEIPLAAVGFLLLTVVTFSIYTVTIRRLSPRAEPLVVATVTTIGGTAVALPLLVFEVLRGTAVTDDASLSTAVGAGFNGIATSIGYVLFARVLAARASASFAVILYLLPPLAVLCSWAILGEQPQLRHAVGGALVLCAVGIAEHARRRQAPEPQPEPVTA
jgi:drug/metabolite transporter (DMT)-like permease